MDNKIKIAVIGGSGLYDLEGIDNIQAVDIDTPFGKPSDSIITGEYKGVKVGFLPRHGKGHHIMPSSVNYRANIFALKKLGAEKIISVSAVGSMKEDIAPGSVVIVDQFFDHTKDRPFTFFRDGIVVHIAFADPVCPVLSKELLKCSNDEGMNTKKGGTYLCMEGPQFSTLGESRIYRTWGVDVIGMTALPEAKLAREAEICYSTLALVTDYDCWHTEHDAVSVEMVIRQLLKNTENAKKVLSRVIESYSRELLPSCECGRALKNAIMTAPDKVDPKLKADLDILVGKYLK